jgi:hypothetical protein
MRRVQKQKMDAAVADALAGRERVPPVVHRKRLTQGAPGHALVQCPVESALRLASNRNQVRRSVSSMKFSRILAVATSRP